VAKISNNIGIIPARMGSTRFPGKPLAEICGMSMIEHVYRRSAMAKTLRDVYIATPDREIEDHCRKRGMNVVMTSHKHERASDRAAEAMLKIEKKEKTRVDILVMIQGDEPMVLPQMIDKTVRPLIKDRMIPVANMVSPIKTKKEFEDENEIKVVMDKQDFAIYFSREPIPSRAKWSKAVPMLKQVCIIPFQRDFLLTFNRIKQQALEQIESIDMLRCLENGYPVKLVYGEFNTYSVDTPADLKKVQRLMKKDALLNNYR